MEDELLLASERPVRRWYRPSFRILAVRKTHFGGHFWPGGMSERIGYAI